MLGVDSLGTPLGVVERLQAESPALARGDEIDSAALVETSRGDLERDHCVPPVGASAASAQAAQTLERMMKIAKMPIQVSQDQDAWRAAECSATCQVTARAARRACCSRMIAG